MGFNALTAVVLLACTSIAHVSAVNAAVAKPPITFSSIMPAKLSVKIAFYTIANKTVLADTARCLSQAPGSPCLTNVHAARDKVHIIYNVLPQYKSNLTDSVMLKGCYSNFSSVDRPFRAYNNIIAKSKRCPFIIAQNLNPTAGNATWKVPNTVPIGTYFIRAFVLKNSTIKGKPQAQVAFGTSKGFFEVQPISGITGGMKIAAGICGAVGPTFIIGYFAVQTLMNKRK